MSICGGVAQLVRVLAWHARGHRFKSARLHHVGASSAYNTPSKGWGICMLPLLLLFRKKSRSAHLLGCKRPRDGSLSLPTFCGLLLKQIFILSKVSTSRWIPRFITRLVFWAGFQIASSPLLISRKSPATLRLFAAYHFFAIARLWRAWLTKWQFIFGSLLQVGASSAYITPPKRRGICLLRCSSFSAKSHTRRTCSVVNAFATVRCLYQLFAGSR